MLGLGAEVDEDDGDSLLGTLYVGVGSSTWLTLVAGQSSSPADRADIEADTLAIGVDHRFEKVGFTLEAEQLGRLGSAGNAGPRGLRLLRSRPVARRLRV